MSEYQYYEFRSVDRPLTKQEMAELRSLSTRAEITPTRFTNTYHFGNFGGSPEDMIEKYFDAHVYVANWGSFHLMLRLPLGVIEDRVLAAYAVEDVLDFWTTDEHTIISWVHSSEDGWEEWVEGEGWIDQLLPIRDELEQGNYRALYLGWLLGVHLEWLDEDEIEPPVPSGDRTLTKAQEALIEFLHIDVDLAAAVLEGTAVNEIDTDEEDRMRECLDQVSEADARGLLLRVLRGEPREVQRELHRRYNQFLRENYSTELQAQSSQRTVRMLLDLVEDVRQKRLEREAAELAREQAEQERQRRAYLTQLAQRFPETWEQIEALAQQQTASAYDQAHDLLVDLSDAYAQTGRADEFSDHLTRFVEKNARRQALMRRLKESKLI